MSESLAAENLRTEWSAQAEQFEVLMEDSKRHPLLTAEQEKVLGRQVQAGLTASERLAANRYRKPERRAEDEAIMAQGLVAKESMSHSNIRLVGKWARYYEQRHPIGANFGLMDLFQEGYIGLEHAVDKFDPEKGFKFSTYATWWIRQAIVRAMFYQGTTVRIPVHIHEKMEKLRKLEAKEESKSEILDELEIDEGQLITLQEARQHIHPLTSLDVTPENGSGDVSLVDLLPDSASSQDFKKLIGEKEDHDIVSPQMGKVIELLRPFLTPADHRLLFNIMSGESLSDNGQTQLRRLEGVLEHPSVYAKLQELSPVRETPIAPDWRESTPCQEVPEMYFSRHLKKPDQARLEEMCGSCAVKAQCEAYFYDNLPTRGKWAGQSYNQLRKQRDQSES